MTTTAIVVIVIVVGLLANAALIYVALSRLRDAREIAHGRPSARSIHEAWHRPGEPVTASAALPRIGRVRAVPQPDPTAQVGAVPEAEEDRALAAAIADFVRSAQVVARADEPSTRSGADARIAPEPSGGLAAQRGRAGRASVVVVDVQAGSGRVGLGQPRDIEVSVARALRRTARDADEVRRLGDASFAVVLAGTRGPGADAFVGRARKALADVLAPYRGSTFSIAAEDVADVADDPDEALRRALQALDAKREDHPKRGRPVVP